VASRGIRIPAVYLALVGQLVGVFGLPVVTGRESPSNAPVTACGCSAEDRDAGRCCCHRPALPPCCAKKAAAQAKESCCVGHDDSSRTPVVQWVNPSVRQKCLGDTPATAAQPVTPSIAPDMPAGLVDEPNPVGRIAVNDLFPISRLAAPDDPPPRPA
jgi:hypothetical protein